MKVQIHHFIITFFDEKINSFREFFCANLYKTIFDEINFIGKDTGILPQIIIVDHVDGNNLECKEEFNKYVRCNWRSGKALI